MKILVADLEGVFLPEIWINVAKKTGIEELKLTTRDISDYDVLMTKRLSILDEHNLTLKDIQDVIAGLEPLDGAKEMLDWIRKRTQIIILSDTFEEFAGPLMEKLGFPALLCHNLTVDATNRIIGYNLRIDNQKARAVKALQGLNYHVIAFGDSYNDTGMILSADQGFFFKPPESITKDFPDIPITRSYDELQVMLTTLLAN
ncbi:MULTISPECIES: bifunctional phosphoserine phosphatase/homoserine phosphotransferase ThrH [Desulfobacter]|jgi:phosphoserine/homoserine phosphotransferase|uniref:bifunctional phosphoserine phosphatase/homoserine phosphotransferase ThrH n=1 Tax=Desulfobacter TaxID=2289 RepID=UPI000E90A57A|nr:MULTISPECIES: bifunctional phosphoserine phosphatase/homoserine phosphotransferase ThrH [Desulfobacter]MBP9599347.1 bifunctional phosphoserine phosphatase/homoserine phosphotransferase ThrH [Desulfobacter sp.]MDX9964675.1 bifunctional phosphoserine phosphatase/homoserine phosphotransferase ThrH [Desulfobacter postgatei]HAR34724.1 bifunctional phosphoserine phosphatase/homoserine phosphotransferase ThrH [Desulfobacter sp.]HBT88057.1 bifunctional phosphoserine phosphatase/homoserine phosphotra